MSAAQKETTANFTIIDSREAFAADFNAILDTIEWIVVSAVVLPERDFSDFTI